MIEKAIGDGVLKVIIGDIADLDIEAFVYHARKDLLLGAGFGGAIAVRGGPSIQEELKKLGPLEVGQAVVTSAGNMKCKHIIHAVAPTFEDAEDEAKLVETMLNALARAEEKGIRQVAFPPLGAGFYTVPLGFCARVMVRAAGEYLRQKHGIRELVFCVRDNREYQAFKAEFEKAV